MSSSYLMQLRLGVILAAVALCAPETAPAASYKEPEKGQPHAVLKFSAEKGVSAGTLLGLSVQKIIPLEINLLPPNALTKINYRSFRVEPGPMKVLVQAAGRRRLIAICLVEFDAAAGAVYEFQSMDGADSITVRVLDAEQQEVATCEGKKQLAPQGAPTPIFVPS
jgi:hypothetical protein